MTYDDLDKQIINVLLEDGRASLRSIAAELDVAATTVSNVLADLEENDIIDGYEPRIDYEKIGLGITTILHLDVEGGALHDVAEQLAESDHLVSVYEVTGEHDVVAIGKFTDTAAMNAHVKTLLDQPGIKETNSSVVLSIPCEYDQFPVELEE